MIFWCSCCWSLPDVAMSTCCSSSRNPSVSSPSGCGIEVLPQQAETSITVSGVGGGDGAVDVAMPICSGASGFDSFEEVTGGLFVGVVVILA